MMSRYYLGQRDASGCSVFITDDPSTPVAEMQPLPKRLETVTR